MNDALRPETEPARVPTSSHQKAKWQLLAPLGLALIGFGVSVVGYAVELRVGGAARAAWFAWGTFGLVVLNSGVACFGEAVKCSVLMGLGRE